MDTKALLYGLIGFFAGGLLVSVAATTFNKQERPYVQTAGMSMAMMTADLGNKQGDDYDKAFINHMIAHHQSAVDMARLSAERARHDEIKQLSRDIISAQQTEIDQMRQWQRDWGYGSDSPQHTTH